MANKDRQYQRDIKDQVKSAWSLGYSCPLVVLPTGGGKCLGKGTPVIMFDGRVVPVETIRVGDLLMGPDSAPRQVVSLARGQEQMYSITPLRGGDPHVVNASHILSLKRTATKRADPEAGTVVNVSVRDYLSSSKYFKHLHKLWRTGVDFLGSEALPVPPYILGVWLGDGDSDRPMFTTGDREILEALKDYAKSEGLVVGTSYNSPNSVKVSITSGPGAGRNKLTQGLKAIKVLNDKHIPPAYKAGHRQDRLQLLAGLIDTDGYYSGKNFEVTFKSEKLLDDLIFVARSLGFSAAKKVVQKTCHNNGVVGTYYRCHIAGDLNTIPCKLRRMQAARRTQKKSHLVSGFKIEPLGLGEYFGFTLAGPDRLFLLGDFTVTHNTHIFSGLVQEEAVPSCVIAHRQELVRQISMAIARTGLAHRIIGAKKVIKQIIKAHVREFGKSFYDPSSDIAVAGVDTLIKRDLSRDPWAKRVKLWVQDEGHHVLKGNKWGKAAALFPGAKGLLVTATPERADGRGLGLTASGLADMLIQGPTMQELIDMGYLSPFRIIGAPIDFHAERLKKGGSGDFTHQSLVEAMDGVQVGDVVRHYQRYAAGKRGVTFVTDVAKAHEMAAQYVAAGVPAVALSAETDDDVRAQAVEDLASGKILQICNVDLLGEGFDCPGIEVVSMVRPTESYAVYAQQFGRALRILAGKTHAIILDHVGNVLRHGGPPTQLREWSLDDRAKRSSGPSDAIPLRYCTNTNCLQPYERFYQKCPHCGHVEPKRPAAGRTLQEVDGDLVELDPVTLQALLAESNKWGKTLEERRDELIANGQASRYADHALKSFRNHKGASDALRDTMALWCGAQERKGLTVREAQKLFYLRHGIDVLTAQGLPADKSVPLAQKLEAEIYDRA